jgi:hypothetical protein
VRQIDGKYNDQVNFDYMMRMGVFTENLSLPAVLNECLMQSYTDVIRLFPNTHKLGPARFQNLRAAGAFLVSAVFDGKTVSELTLLSEKGATVRLVNPWPQTGLRAIRMRDDQPVRVAAKGEIIEFPTKAGERYRVERMSSPKTMPATR